MTKKNLPNKLDAVRGFQRNARTVFQDTYSWSLAMNTLSIVESIFFTALEKETPEARAAYLDDACKGDSNMRRYIDRMLNAHPKLDGFLQQSPAPRVEERPATIESSPIEERPGTIIGPYKLLQQLGEGGFGVVFMAEQEKPVRRKVALKIIKPGMDSKQVVARFEAERQSASMLVVVSVVGQSPVRRW
jgi:eukaryotic-like serine/threonine-protein kinase